MANKTTKQTKLAPEYKVQHVPINSIKSNADNPRIIKDDKFKKLVKSIAEFPQMLELRPIIVDNDMVILGGNMRHKAAMECGLQIVPIVIAEDLTEDQKREFIIKDNVGFGEWDWELLANEWDADLLVEWGLDVPVDSSVSLDDLSEDIQPTYRIEVICKDEEHQEKVYNKLIAEGFECKLLTL